MSIGYLAKLIASEIIADRLDDATYGLSALQGDVSGVDGKIDTVDGVVDSILSDVQDGTYGLSALQSDISTVDGKIDTVDGVADSILSDVQDGTYGLSAIQTDVSTVDGKVDTIDGKIDTVDGVADSILSDVQNVTYGLSALKTLIDGIDTGRTLQTNTYGKILDPPAPDAGAGHLMTIDASETEMWSGDYTSVQTAYNDSSAAKKYLVNTGEDDTKTIVNVRFDLSWRGQLSGGGSAGSSKWYVQTGDVTSSGFAIATAKAISDAASETTSQAEHHCSGSFAGSGQLASMPFTLALCGITDAGTLTMNVSSLSEVTVVYGVS